MAAIGLLAITTRWPNRYDNREYIRYSADPNDVNWSSVTINIPPSILNGILEGVHVESSGATIAHASDDTVSGDRATLSITRGASTPTAQAMTSKPIGGANGSSTGAVPLGWATDFGPLAVHVRGGDSIGMQLPPAEDNVAATGTYDIFITIRVLDYAAQ